MSTRCYWRVGKVLLPLSLCKDWTGTRHSCQISSRAKLSWLSMVRTSESTIDRMAVMCVILGNPEVRTTFATVDVIEHSCE